MSRSRPLRSAFTAGEWSPRLLGRVDLDKYHQAAATIENLLVQPQGGLVRRAGTKFAAEAKSRRVIPRAIPFEFGAAQSYMIEAGDEYFRFYANGGQIVVSGSPVAVVNGDFSDGLTGWTDESTGDSEIAVAGNPVVIPDGTGTPIGNMTLGGGLAAAFGGVLALTGYRYHRLKITGGETSRRFSVAQVQFFEGQKGDKLIKASTGTRIGNMTEGEGLAAAFDGDLSKLPVESALSDNGTTAYIGKDWGSGNTKIVTGFELWSSTGGIKVKTGFEIQHADITIELQGSDDNFASSIVTLATTTVGDKASVVSVEFHDDGKRERGMLDCAVSEKNLATIGKDWGNGNTKTVVGVKLWGAKDVGFKDKGNPEFTVRLQGSANNFASSVVTLAEKKVRDRNDLFGIGLFDGIDVSTAYRYHRVELRGGQRDAGFVVSEVKFYEAGAALQRLRLIPDGGTAIAEQQITVATEYRNVPHVLRFRVYADPGEYCTVQIGQSSGGTAFLKKTKCDAGWHTFEFVPSASPIYLQFRSYGGKETAIDDVSLVAGDEETPYEIRTPWGESELPDLRWAQAGDVMWLVHPRVPPYKLIRRDHTEWTLQKVKTIDGPYLAEDPDNDIAISASALTGTVTLTASDGLFSAGHVGALWRLGPAGGVPGHATWKANEAVSEGDYRKYEDNVYVATADDGTTGNSAPVHDRGTVSDGTVGWTFVNRAGWGYVVITEFASSTSVTAKVRKRLDPSVSSGTTVWREGAFSLNEKFPSCVALVGGRLVYGKGIDLYLSRSGLYDEFTPDGQDDDGINLTLSGAVGSPIQWIAGQERIFVGTAAGPWIIRASSEDEPLTPENAQARQVTAAGSADLDAFKVGESILYFSRSGRRLHELGPSAELVSGFQALDLTILADHVLKDGARVAAYAHEPHPVLWVLRRDGQLAALTYNRAEGVIAWSRHVLGGAGWYSLGGQAIETDSARAVALAVIPGADDAEKRDEVWMIVRRMVGGVPRMHIEYLESDLTYDAAPEDAFLVDAGVMVEDVQSVTLTPGLGATTAESRGVVFTAGASIWVFGDKGRLIAGPEDALAKITKVINVTTAECTIIRPFPNTAQIAKGNWRMSFTTISGLGHLKRETVNVLADGGYHDQRTVSASGTIELDRPTFLAAVGLPVLYRYKSLKIIEGGQAGPAIGAKRKVSHAQLGFIGSLECRAGIADGDKPARLERAIFREVSDEVGKPPPLFTGERLVAMPDGWLTDPRLVIEGDGAQPLTLTHWLLDDIRTEELK